MYNIKNSKTITDLSSAWQHIVQHFHIDRSDVSLDYPTETQNRIIKQGINLDSTS